MSGSSILGRILAILLCILTLQGIGFAFEINAGKRVVLSGFKTRGCREDGRLQWELQGATATLRRGLAELSDVLLTFHLEDGRTAVVSSPKCMFNQGTKIGKSTAPIHVQSRTVVLDGVGYDILANKQKLHIRSKVRMCISTAGGLQEKAAVGGETVAPEKPVRP